MHNPNYGCGDADCVGCYPFTYRCEHGVDFPSSVPNGQPEPECEDLHDEMAEG